MIGTSLVCAVHLAFGGPEALGSSLTSWSVGWPQPDVQKTSDSTADEVKRLRRSAEKGDAEAQFKLALRYDNGEGVPKDRKRAAEWYRKAAEQGIQEAAEALRTLGEK